MVRSELILGNRSSAGGINSLWHTTCCWILLYGCDSAACTPNSSIVLDHHAINVLALLLCNRFLKEGIIFIITASIGWWEGLWFIQELFSHTRVDLGSLRLLWFYWLATTHRSSQGCYRGLWLIELISIRPWKLIYIACSLNTSLRFFFLFESCRLGLYMLTNFNMSCCSLFTKVSLTMWTLVIGVFGTSVH